MSRIAACVVVAAALSGCMKSVEMATGDTDTEFLEVTVMQRGSAALSGLDEAISVRLGDITDGAVDVDLIRHGAASTLAASSMKAGDVLAFDLGGVTYYLGLRKLKNVAVGDDYAMFVVSRRRPEFVKAEGDRPASWAEPIEVAGAPNLHKVSEGLYRSAQPTAEGMANLKELGIKTVVNLRSLHSDRDEIGASGLDYEHIRMKAWHAEDEDVVRFLKIVTDPARAPVLVHCQHGADRTGTMCAIYRLVVSGWSKEDAVNEMTKGGFGYHAVWSNLPKYLEKLDVDAIKAKAGLE
jgi:protein tyrosine phosphatase (PTP) superfamily phosphohydrolase (DUF442 family)